MYRSFPIDFLATHCAHMRTYQHQMMQKRNIIGASWQAPWRTALSVTGQVDHLLPQSRLDPFGSDPAPVPGALKNVYAIDVGMGYSLGIGENTRAMVIARAVREMFKLGEAVGGQRDTFAGRPGMGDLIVTCTSPRSRNRHVGEQLGAGKQIDEIIASINQVAGGVNADRVVMEFADSYGIAICRLLAKSTASSIAAKPPKALTAV
jgi:hypothetical protein